MERKHATVLALTFVLVGLMFFQVDTPLILQQDVETVVHEAPEIVEQIAVEPVPQEPLRLNVVENSDFENWDSVMHRPDEWSAQASAFQNADDAYTDIVHSGIYSGYTESQGSTLNTGMSYLRSAPTSTALIEPGISVSFYWNALANPDIDAGSEVYFFLRTRNGLGSTYDIYYFLHTGIDTYSNTTYAGKIMVNDTINQWNNFDRNITEDFIELFGVPALTSQGYVDSLWFYAKSVPEATDKVQAIFDDVILYNSTYTGWIENGGFETGTGSGWTFYNTDSGYVSQTTDKTHGTYSLNMSIPRMRGGSANARSFMTFPPNFGYHALYPSMNIISLDWKYNDTVGAGPGQYSYFRMDFYNGTTYTVHFVFGYGSDTILLSNSTTNIYIKMPGFGVRDTWQHSEIDVFEVCNELHLYNISIATIDFYVYSATVDAGVELLVDDFKMMTYPTSDPTFEYIENWGRYDPFTGWERNYGDGDVTQSTVAHGGTYSANLTVENGKDGLLRNLLYTEIDPALSTDFWWRLEDLQNTGLAYALIDLEFIVSGSNRHIVYILGKSPSQTFSNDSSYVYITVEGFNQTGTWNHLARNITADIEEGFSIPVPDCRLFSFTVEISAAAGMRTSLLVDDLHFMDMVPPSIDTVAFSSTQYYYSNGYLQVSASDARPGISEVMINYTSNGGSSWNTISTTYDSDWYEVNIPAQDYGTTVEFSVIAIDGCGLVTINDNGGAYYSYYVDDNADPLLTITNPVNNTDQSGLLAITADAFDAGAGVEYVSFNADGSGAITDTTAPYSQNWNLDDESLGSHYVVVTVRDNAGNEVTKTHYFTVVDTVDPVLDSPDDVAFTVGATGHIIDWNPTDVRPASYEIFVDTISTYSGLWNSSSEHLVVNLDGLSIGTYNYTCVVTDDGANSVVDTVFVTVSAESTTTTTTTPSTTTTIPPPGDLTLLVIVAVVGVVGILLVVFVVLPKMKKT